MKTLNLIIAGILVGNLASAALLPPVQPHSEEELQEILSCDGGRLQLFKSTSPYHSRYFEAYINETELARSLLPNERSCLSSAFGPCLDNDGRQIISGFSDHGVNGGAEFQWMDSLNSEFAPQDPHPLTTVLYRVDGGIRLKVVHRYDMTYTCTSYSTNSGGLHCDAYDVTSTRRAVDEEVESIVFKNCVAR